MSENGIPSGTDFVYWSERFREHDATPRGFETQQLTDGTEQAMRDIAAVALGQQIG